ncbi:MAG: tyrosine--tRNA ligase [Pirellulaceae bacterium]
MMTSYALSDIYADLTWRNLIHQSTDEANLPQWLLGNSRTVYAGFDPTSDSLHIGNLMPLMMLRRFQRAGHRPIALAGGATGMIGDPSGKSAERNLLSVEQLQANLQAIDGQLRGILDFDCGDQSAVVVNNFDWMRSFSYLDFLRDVGKNFPVNVMLAKDSVKGRLERTDSGLSYTEFSYMLLQAFDFVHLFRNFECQLQVGGSDQWGNITAGIDLGRRMCSAQLFGLTCPLLVKADGTKMGKTESGSIWLAPEKTSPYAFYQYWFNVADADVDKCLRFLTEIPEDEIESLAQQREASPETRASQTRLAEEVTTLIHGPTELAKVIRATNVLHGAEIDQQTDEELNTIFADVPSHELPKSQLDDGLPILDALVAAGLSNSKSDARRLVQQGGVYVNNRRLSDFNTKLDSSDLVTPTIIVLRSGKKKYALLRFQ